MKANIVDDFRVVTWNCRGARIVSGVWDYLLEMNPDVALLQEVGEIPVKVRSIYKYEMRKARKKDGSPQRFSTALLVKGRISNELMLSSHEKWVEEELQRFSGNLIALDIQPFNESSIKAISVHSPDWFIDPERLQGIDTTGVRLTLQKRNIWAADLLWASLKHQRQDLDQPWLVAGDFNYSETFDWRGKPRGNREYLDRMAELGFIECLRHCQGKLTPTYRNKSGGCKDQIDFLFVSKVLAKRVITCDTGSFERVFNSGLSDHLPIIADFRETD